MSDSSRPYTPYTFLRMLIANTLAGAVIGKGGARISSIQAQTGARIHLSSAREFFPGTQDRIAEFSGRKEEIERALRVVFTILAEEAASKDNLEPVLQPTPTVRILVPTGAAGAVIGRAGANIKLFTEESGGKIKVSPPDEPPGVGERMVAISGLPEQQLRAVHLILNKLITEHAYVSFRSLPAAYGGPSSRLALQTPLLQALPLNLPASIPKPKLSTAYSATVTMSVPDEHVGALIGKGGKVLLSIQDAHGVKVKLSERGDFIPGTQHRKVTITGPPQGAMAAQQVVAQIVRQQLDGALRKDHKSDVAPSQSLGYDFPGRGVRKGFEDLRIGAQRLPREDGVKTWY